MLKRLILIAIFLTPGLLQAERKLPEQGYVGKLTAYRYPEVRIDDRVLRLSPAARIVNYDNLLILPDHMPWPVPVLFQLDMQGNVRQIWLLTAPEYQALSATARPKPVPLPAQ